MRRPLSPEEMAERLLSAGRGALNDVLGNTQLDAAVREARALIAAGDKPTPFDPSARTLLGLHAVFHETTYGCPPEELRGRAYFGALASCRSLLASPDFKDDVELAISYVAWAWEREGAWERKRQEKGGEPGRRLTWSLVFGKARTVLGDWKVAMSRRRGAA